jgi:hypothetical protein
MPGLVPGIHVLLCRQGVDARVKRGHDGGVNGDSDVSHGRFGFPKQC